jgi:lysozyme
MILTEGLLEMIRRHEGLSLKPYLCPGGHATIGYGWNMDAHPLPDDIAACLRLNGAITKDMAERLLNISVDMATRQARAIYPGFDDFTERRRYALVDFVFNLGAGGAMQFKKMRNAIEVRDWDRAADMMMDSKWYRQVGNRAKTVVGLIREG